MSTGFTNALTNDGIALTYVGSKRLAQVRKTRFNLSPRIGVAYQLSSKLAFRAGAGLFTGALENQGLLANLGGNYPFQSNVMFASPTDAAPIVYPSGAVATLGQGLTAIPLDASKVNGRRMVLRGLEYDARTPYTESFSAALQYQRTPHEIIQLSYAGSLGRHLITNPGLNQVGLLLPPTKARQDYVLFQNFAYGSSYIAMQGSSYYHALQLSFTRKLDRGLSLLGSYTYSKARTNAHDLTSSGGDQPYRAPSLPSFGIQGDYGLANFDIRHSLRMGGGYELPVGAGRRFLAKRGRILDKFIGGWILNWVLTLQGGQPVTIPCTIATLSGAGCYALFVPGQSPTGGQPNVNRFWNPAAFENPEPATSIGAFDWTPLGGAPTQVTGPGFRRVDLALRKDLKTSERTHLEFRVEVYNLANHPNFALPSNLNFSDPTHFGQISSTSDNPNDARQIQLALKFFF